jgi:hypothetical protein
MDFVSAVIIIALGGIFLVYTGYVQKKMHNLEMMLVSLQTKILEKELSDIFKTFTKDGIINSGNNKLWIELIKDLTQRGIIDKKEGQNG